MYQSFISTSLEGGAQCARIATFRVPRPDKRRKYCALVLVFLPGLVYIAGSVVLWLIDCALTVVSTMCAGNRRRCPSFIYTTACDAAHGSRSSRILFLPGGRGAAAAFSMEARSNRMGTRTHARGTPGTGLYSKIVMVCAQCALRGSCLWTCSLCS